MFYGEKECERKINILICLLMMLCLIGCGSYESNSNTQKERPVWVEKKTDVVITDIYKNTWFATVRRYEVTYDVYSKEYDLEETFFDYDQGAFLSIDSWDYEEGDVLKAVVCQYVIPSTGKVTNQYISEIRRE